MNLTEINEVDTLLDRAVHHRCCGRAFSASHACPVCSDPTGGPAERGDFLPLRSVPKNAARVAEQLRARIGMSRRDRCNLQSVCDLLAIRVVRADFDPQRVRTPAFLAPNGGLLVVVLAPVIAEDMDRKRFVVAHEVGHALFYERRRGVVGRRTKITIDEEVFCDAFARALLLPRDVLGSIAQRGELGRIAEQYGLPATEAAVEAARVWGVDVAVARQCTEESATRSVRRGS